MSQIYTYDEVYNYSLEYFNGDELAASVFVDKYALRNGEGELLEATPHDMHFRIATEIARIEAKKFASPLSFDKIFGYLDRFNKIVPQGSPMYGIGNPYQYATLSNCYVVASPNDAYSSILKTDEQIVQISKRRGGVGVDISNLRPNGTPVKNAARTSSGIVPFMQRYSNTIREVGQSGRRGALLETISVHHPQVLDFAHAKDDAVSVTGANISIRITDEFLNAVEQGVDYQQRWPVDSKNPVVSRMVDARTVWMDIIRCAHNRAEPGLLFWDNIIRESPADCYARYGFVTICCNPCGELTLCFADSCRLLVLMLFGYVKNPFTESAHFDFDEFYKDAQIAQRFMDDIVDLELEQIDTIINKIKKDPESAQEKQVELDLWGEIRRKCSEGRRTGTGITALGDVIAALGLRYGSDESIETTEKIYRTLKLACYRSSVDMAKELGPFPIWNPDLETECPFLLRIKDEDAALYADMQKYGRRNIALLTTAPTGTVSVETQTTSGIEPLFQEFYVRRKKINDGDGNATVDFIDQSGDKWREFKVYHPKLKVWQEVTGQEDVSLSPYHDATAEKIDWRQRVKLQAAANRHVDHSISSTINLPEDVSVEAVAEIYETAWKAGCKGITVYRKNCRTGVLVDAKPSIPKTQAPKRPKALPCEIYHTVAKGEKYYVIIGLLDGEPYEVFAARDTLSRKYHEGVCTKLQRGKYRLTTKDGELIAENISDDCTDDEEALLRMLSTSLRHGADINFVVHQLEKVRGDLQSMAKCLGRVLKKYIKDGTRVSGEVCQECGQASLVRNSGCVMCSGCGWSKCS
jgi:ribonucleoside-diphosphate reductase alpha chain